MDPLALVLLLLGFALVCSIIAVELFGGRSGPVVRTWRAAAEALGLSFGGRRIPTLAGQIHGRAAEVRWPGIVRLEVPPSLGFDISGAVVTGDEALVAAVFDGPRQARLEALVREGTVTLRLGQLTVTSLKTLKTVEEVRGLVMATLLFLEELEAISQRPVAELLEEGFLREPDSGRRARLLELLLVHPFGLGPAQRVRVRALSDPDAQVVLAAASQPPDAEALERLVRDEAVPAKLRARAADRLSKLRRAEGKDGGNLSIARDSERTGALSIPGGVGAVSLAGSSYRLRAR